MKKILPIVLLLIGSAAGVGAGIFLRPEAATAVTDTAEVAAKKKHTEEKESDADPLHDDHEDTYDEKAKSNEYVKLNNQFVVPIVSDEKVVALVVLALSVEVPAGKTDVVYEREPKLRDSFLQVLFDHANIGGFEGNFTDAAVLKRLRTALKEVAQKDLGKDNAKDVLIVEIARQDY